MFIVKLLFVWCLSASQTHDLSSDEILGWIWKKKKKKDKTEVICTYLP